MFHLWVKQGDIEFWSVYIQSNSSLKAEKPYNMLLYYVQAIAGYVMHW